MLTVGSQGGYEWMVTDGDFDLLELCPEIVLGKYLAITSFDSGEFVVNDTEAASGWQSRGGIAYSPQITSQADVPRDGWDEWYIFTSASDLGKSHLKKNIFEVPQESRQVSVFVNYGFALCPPERAGLADLFWPQLARIRPESYVADNDLLTFVTMNKALFASVYHAVKAVAEP